MSLLGTAEGRGLVRMRAGRCDFQFPLSSGISTALGNCENKKVVVLLTRLRKKEVTDHTVAFDSIISVPRHT